jgi:CheY-like chemotaxis protein
LQLRKEENMKEQLRGTVLCVDDDADERRALAWVLEAAGLEEEEAATGGEGLRLAARNPGLVVLDVNLPDIDGFEVCRRIKAHPATAGIPVLHISGVFVNPDDVNRALAEGADGYLTKPVDPQVLLAWTRALLRSRPTRGSGAEVFFEPIAVNGDPHPEFDTEGEKGDAPVYLPTGQTMLRAGGAGEDGDAFLGIAVALGIEACLAVLVVLPLCGVAVPGWAAFLALAPTLVLLALCGWAGRGGRQ